MEALKTFENLSDTDKIKFFEVLSYSRDLEISAKTSTEESTSTLSKKTDFTALLEQLKRGIIKNAEQLETTPITTESKAKQKTLDSWLIKKEKTLPIIERTEKDINVNNTSVYKSPSKATVLHTDQSPKMDTLEESNKRQFVDSCVIKENDEQMKNCSFTICPTGSELSGNLRRSKRKSSKPCVNINDSNESASKNASVNNAVVQKKVRLVKNSKNGTNKSDSLLSNSSSELAPVKTLLNKNSLKSTNIDIDLENHNSAVPLPISPSSPKKTYNLRTKRKAPKKFQQYMGSEVLITPDSVASHQFKDNITLNHNTDRNHSQSEADLVSESEYKAYNKISAKCTQFGLNIHDILSHESVQKLLNNYKEDLPNNVIIFIGSHKSDSGKITPVVHMHSNKFKLVEKLHELNKNLSV